MSVQATIEQKLTQALTPNELQVVNESHMHSVPENSETHFKVVIVAADFAAMRKVARHQKIYQILADELAGCVHALAIHAYSVDEWQLRQGEVPASPDCLGGSKQDAKV